jgi:hypothetical protein
LGSRLQGIGFHAISQHKSEAFFGLDGNGFPCAILAQSDGPFQGFQAVLTIGALFQVGLDLFAEIGIKLSVQVLGNPDEMLSAFLVH